MKINGNGKPGMVLRSKSLGRRGRRGRQFRGKSSSDEDKKKELVVPEEELRDATEHAKIQSGL